VPRLEVIGYQSQLTPQTDIEELIPVGELFASYAGIVDAAEPNPSGQRNWRSVNIQSHIPYREWIKRILDRHANAVGTARPYGSEISSGNVEWIRRKWHGCQCRIEIRPRIFKVAKYCQVFVAYVARERTVVHLTVARRQRRRNRGEVIGRVVSIAGHRISQIINAAANTKRCRAD